MANVFCKECMYFYRPRHNARCEHPDNQETKHDWEQSWTSPIRPPCRINKNNNCKWFEKEIGN